VVEPSTVKVSVPGTVSPSVVKSVVSDVTADDENEFD
jgi:hypothetical protein